MADSGLSKVKGSQWVLHKTRQYSECISPGKKILLLNVLACKGLEEPGAMQESPTDKEIDSARSRVIPDV